MMRSVNCVLRATLHVLPEQVPPELTVIVMVESVVRADVSGKWSAAHARATSTTVPPRSRTTGRMVVTSYRRGLDLRGLPGASPDSIHNAPVKAP